MIICLEKAVELESTRESLSLLMNAYVEAGMELEAKAISRKLDRSEKAVVPAKRKVKRPKRVIV
jgi:hypothetical protein